MRSRDRRDIGAPDFVRDPRARTAAGAIVQPQPPHGASAGDQEGDRPSPGPHGAAFVGSQCDCHRRCGKRPRPPCGLRDWCSGRLGSPALQRDADEVIRGDGPSAVAPYIRQAANSLRLPPDRKSKITLHVTGSGGPIEVLIGGRNVLIAGDPRSGKSWLTGLYCEHFMLHDYCT